MKAELSSKLMDDVKRPEDNLLELKVTLAKVRAEITFLLALLCPLINKRCRRPLLLIVERTP
jgi:hypothetical protein